MSKLTTPARLSGVFPIAPTPFSDAGDLDLEGQRRVLDCMIDQGVDGVCILANYSEQFALLDVDRDTLLDLCLGHVAGRLPVGRARRAEAAGAQMVMLMPPYHGASLRADDAGVYEFFACVAEAVSVPIMVQDAPLSGVTLSVSLLARLARELGRVRYFKIEVPGTAAKLRALLEAAGEAIAGPFDGGGAAALMAGRGPGGDGRGRGARPQAGRAAPRPDPADRRAPPRGPARGGERAVCPDPTARELREPAVRAARNEGRDGRGQGHSQRGRAPSADSADSDRARWSAGARARAAAAPPP